MPDNKNDFIKAEGGVGEEIREELAKRRYYDGWMSIGGSIPTWEDRTEVEREHFREKIDDDFKYLHSQGVVIKVERGTPTVPDNFEDQAYVYLASQADMLEVGYVAVEPLVKVLDW